MKNLRAAFLLGAGLCAGVLVSVGLQAFAIKQTSSLPLQEVRQFTSVFNAVKDFYVDDVSDQELLQFAMEGMVSGLDPHSSFLDADGFKDMDEATHGSFGGLGLEVTKDPSGVRVVSPIDDTPAAAAGVAVCRRWQDKAAFGPPVDPNGAGMNYSSAPVSVVGRSI